MKISTPGKMNLTKKFDRAFQWAGEKMGGEAKTNLGDDFKMLEMEMALRFDGMERLQRSMNAYVKWLGRRDTFEDKEKGLAGGYLGRTMVSHGEDFESDSDFGNCLIALGRANENCAAYQEQLVADATTVWLESLERSLATMKDYQAARKKLENRRLAYDASMTKLSKARRDDYRIEEEVRSAKAKYEETTEDVCRRMQDIKDAEADSTRDLTGFLDAELEYHERCAEELRRTRENWAGANVQGSPSRSMHGGFGRPGAAALSVRSRSSTNQSLGERLSRTNTSGSTGNSSVQNYTYEEHEPAPPVRMPTIRSASRISANGAAPDIPARPGVARSNTFQGGATIERNTQSLSGSSTPSGYQPSFQQQQNAAATMSANIGSLRGQLRPVSRIVTQPREDNVFADGYDDDTTSSGDSPKWSGDRSSSPATSYGSGASQTTSTLGSRKAPPPPPSRSKKPPPPVPAKREVLY
ncbi:BAR domain-containing protein [Pyricularia oryzae 70-15]|uniref:BAR domain-containing protein n=1 Tax=Pyricularia oryzae (strain 70-15 / ATCC MYA-4617 / FGSC 8958) TaxID=242507 RepID=G4MML8_PYRO7|nr:BAR domain-containing protein [Pyricularia oryzae 70-15]EHA57790.1 BAR domain-containing protein [Pyricularia oryzae 70-15]